MTPFNPDINVTRRFLGIFGGPFTFQTIHDKRGGQCQVLNGTLEEHVADLERRNKAGCGIFWMVNVGDGKGRSSGNVIKPRAVFADFDTPGGLDKIANAPLRPHIIIESSPEKYHAYWLVRDMPLDQFTPTQKAIAEQLGSDPTVCDLPRLMRLPGFCHLKRKPFMTRIVRINE